MILPRSNLRGLQRHPLPTYDRRPMLRLDMNENIGVLPMAVLREALARIDADVLQSYPQYGPLYAKLAHHLAVPADHLLLTNGSDSAAKLIIETFMAPGDHIVLSNPSFAMHKVYATVAQAAITECTFQADFAFPAAAMRQALRPDTRLIIVVTPNNPTGAVIGAAELRALLDQARASDTLVYVDEAYVEYAGGSFVPLVREYDNLVVSRTFSKAMGMPSVRLGVVIGQPRLLEFIRLTQPIYDVNQFAVILGECLLDHYDHIVAYIDQVREGREYLRAELARKGLASHLGQANFALIQPRCDVARLAEAMRARGILISHGFKLPFLTDWIRITVGPVERMRHFLTVLEELRHGG